MRKTNEVDNGEDLVAPGTAAANTYLATHQIALAATPFAEEAFVARRAFINRLSRDAPFPTQQVSEVI